MSEVPADDSVAIPIIDRHGKVLAYTLVDTADADWVNRWSWRLEPYGYAFRGQRVDGRYYPFKLHRELMGLKRGDARQVDHINHDRLDNRRRNLRIVTRSQNQQNRAGATRSSRTGVRGVSMAGDSKNPAYIARVKVGGRTVFSQRFRAISEAAEAVRSARNALMSHATDRGVEHVHE